MTIEKLLGLSIEEQEKLTDEQLLAYFKDALPVTRISEQHPEESLKLKRGTKAKITHDSIEQRANKLLAKYESLCAEATDTTEQ